MRPKLSIIIPTYNAQDSISRIVNTILNQDYENYELIIVNDGSKDDTQGVITQLAKKDSRVVVVSKENGGPSSARNLGLAKARGDYIQFYDADDNIVPGVLSKIVHNMKHNDMVVSGWQINLQKDDKLIEKYKQLTPEPQIIDRNIKEFTLKSFGTDGLMYNLWNKMLKTDIIRANNLKFDESLRFGEDVLFTLDYLKFTKKIQIIPEISYVYTSGSTGSVFRQSSVDPQSRYKNDEALLKYSNSGSKLTHDENIYLQWVRCRWLVSYWSLVASSNKILKQKLKLIRAFKPKQLRPSPRPKYVGLSNSAIIIISYITILFVATRLLFGYTIALVKKHK